MKKKVITIFCGSVLMGIGINGFILPAHIINGGFIGLGLLLNYIFGFKVGISIILLSLPVFLLALVVDRESFYNSLQGMLLSSIIIDGMQPIQRFFHMQIVLSAILGGAFIGFGVGMMLREKACVGGLDLLALLVSKWSSFNIGLLMIIMDAIIISGGMAILQDNSLLYSFLTILTAGTITGLITAIQSVSFDSI